MDAVRIMGERIIRETAEKTKEQDSLDVPTGGILQCTG